MEINATVVRGFGLPFGVAWTQTVWKICAPPAQWIFCLKPNINKAKLDRYLSLITLFFFIVVLIQKNKQSGKMDL